jgi:hypothetical protein
MKTIKWIGPERELPGGIGAIHPEDTIELADWAADSYIMQGLAEELREDEVEPEDDEDLEE